MSRGRAQRSLDLIETSYEILEEIQPATVRAVCYKLFVAKLIDSMSKNETNKISRLLARAREKDEIPWEWIVDDTREPERISAWDNPQGYARAVIRSYRRDYWSQQKRRVEVWSEKSTVRGTLAPILQEYGVTFRVMHGYGSATAVKQIADETEDNDEPLMALYVGDWDPSGLHMSEVDLPRRLDEYGANVFLWRVALDERDANSGLPHFDVEDKKTDSRYRWFIENHGDRCFELDALDPNVLRERVEENIRDEIDFGAGTAAKRSSKPSISLWSRSWRAGASDHEHHEAGQDLPLPQTRRAVSYCAASRADERARATRLRSLHRKLWRRNPSSVV